MNRYSDPGVSLLDFATHFVVHCPKCDGKAIINTEGRLICTACSHVEHPGHWYGAATAYVSVKCRECHAPLKRSAPWNGQWKKLVMHCERCGDICEYEASVIHHSLHNGLMTDRVYGLALWLQKEFRNDLFWAYNYEHLEALRCYIAAKLRERGINPYSNTLRKNSTMVSRLPVFIKKASNRVELLKQITYLSEK